MKARLRILVSVLLFCVIASASFSDSSKDISLELEYGYNPLCDADDDGIENQAGAIDFTVEESTFNWDVDETNLCTAWDTHSISGKLSNSFCHGSRRCCNYLDMQQDSENWDEPLFLQHKDAGYSENNKVLARILYVDYSLDPSNPYMDIHYSDQDYLYAVFPDDMEWNKESGNPPTASTSGIQPELFEDQSISVLLDDPLVNLTIFSPGNSSALTSGEEVLLYFITEPPVDAKFNMDASQNLTLGTGFSFVSLLNGSLMNNILSNGLHQIVIYLKVENQDDIGIVHSFTINDSMSPDISINSEGILLNNSNIL
jgi:hypothetical protein